MRAFFGGERRSSGVSGDARILSIKRASQAIQSLRRRSVTSFAEGNIIYAAA